MNCDTETLQRYLDTCLDIGRLAGILDVEGHHDAMRPDQVLRDVIVPAVRRLVMEKRDG